MGMREELEASGVWLFRRRGYLPLLLFPMLLIAAASTPGPGGSLEAAWEALCIALAVTGLSVRAATAGFVPRDTSGRNRRQPQAESLNRTGLYSVVRHPLYLGNYLMWLGVAAYPRTWWAPVIASLVFWLYYERIMFAEEEFLRRRFGTEYRSWASSTPAFVPRFSSWHAPTVPFSMLTVLRREHSSLLALITALTALEITRDHAASGRLTVDPAWAGVLATTLVLCLAVRTLKHRTSLLHVEGR